MTDRTSRPGKRARYQHLVGAAGRRESCQVMWLAQNGNAADVLPDAPRVGVNKADRPERLLATDTERAEEGLSLVVRAHDQCPACRLATDVRADVAQRTRRATEYAESEERGPPVDQQDAARRGDFRQEERVGEGQPDRRPGRGLRDGPKVVETDVPIDVLVEPVPAEREELHPNGAERHRPHGRAMVCRDIAAEPKCVCHDERPTRNKSQGGERDPAS